MNDSKDLAMLNYGEIILTANGRIRTIDVTDPDNPLELDSDTSVSPQSVITNGNVAYVSLENGGVAIYDMSNPSSINLVSELSMPGHVQRMYINNNMLYLMSQGGEIVDISDPFSIHQ